MYVAHVKTGYIYVNYFWLFARVLIFMPSAGIPWGISRFRNGPKEKLSFEKKQTL